MKIFKGLLPLLFISVSGSLIAQQEKDMGELHGNFQFDGQLYVRDSILDPNAEAYPDERFLGQGFFNLVYTRGGFTAGVRYENYQNVMVGFPQGYRGEGITYRFLQYEYKGLDVTAGNFYEQFGSGMVLRTWEERGLGYDNVFDGARVKYETQNGAFTFKALVGRQRIYFENSSGIVRAIDGEVHLNNLFAGMKDNKTTWSLAGSFVSKYEPDNSPFFNLPENVGSWAGRISANRGNFGFYAEYANKINDPSFDNNYIYKGGEGANLMVNYANKSFGFMVNARRVDNMSYRSERNASQIEGLINYIPAGTKFHTYALPALYPYATQFNGEMGIQAEFNYNIKSKTWLGGKYGTQIVANYAVIHSLYKEPVNVFDSTQAIGVPGTQGYKTDWLKLGQIRYYQDFNIGFKRKLNADWKMTLTYYNIEYNFSLLNKGSRDQDMLDVGYSLAYINAGVLELQYKIKPKHYLRTEFQGLFMNQKEEGKSFDELAAGDMVLILVEYSISPHWFFSVQNIYNFGNPNEEYRLNYPYVNVAYVNGPTRIQMGYGRQPSGIFCVGGVCRFVPASNGLQLTVTSNF